MIIAMCCTSNWQKYLLVDIFALLSTNKVKKLYLFLEEDEFPELENFKEFGCEIEVVNYKKTFKKYLDLKINNTDSALVRIFMSDYIKEEKMLYIDTDAIVVANIEELWKTDIKDYYIAAVWDENIKHLMNIIDTLNLDENKYINSGMMLMNLDKIRKDKIDKYMINLLNKQQYLIPDQDTINIAFKDKIKYVENKYNSSNATGIAEDIKIMHYVGDKSNWIKNIKNNALWYKWEKRYNNFLNNKYVHNNKKEIDMIITVYNTPKHIFKRCLDSLFNQSIIEKILVTIIDDGSDIDYSELLNNYDINYLKNKKNKGVGYSKQKGIDKTELEYIMFFDSDDVFYEDNIIEKMFKIMKYSKDCKMVYGKGINERNQKSKEYINLAQLPGKIYLRKFIKKNKIKLDKSRYNEDSYFNFKYFNNINKEEIEEIDDVVFIYKHDNPNSITNNSDCFYEDIQFIKKINNYKVKKYNSLYLYQVFMFFKNRNIEKVDINYKILYYKELLKFYKKYEKYIKRHLIKDVDDDFEVYKFINEIKEY